MDYWETESEREMILDCCWSVNHKRTVSAPDEQAKEFWKGLVVAGSFATLLWLVVILSLVAHQALI